MRKITYRRAFSLVEVVVGAAIIVSSLVGLLTIFGNLARLNIKNIQAAQAAFLLEQGAEVARYWRDQNWSNVSGLGAGTTYRAVYASSRWSTSTTPTLIDGLFDRTIVATNVNRDSNQDIVTSGGGSEQEAGGDGKEIAKFHIGISNGSTNGSRRATSRYRR
jgi:type II secretory pathway pseudopilin PulG